MATSSMVLHRLGVGLLPPLLGDLGTFSLAEPPILELLPSMLMSVAEPFILASRAAAASLLDCSTAARRANNSRSYATSSTDLVRRGIAWVRDADTSLRPTAARLCASSNSRACSSLVLVRRKGLVDGGVAVCALRIVGGFSGDSGAALGLGVENTSAVVALFSLGDTALGLGAEASSAVVADLLSPGVGDFARVGDFALVGDFVLEPEGGVLGLLLSLGVVGR